MFRSYNFKVYDISGNYKFTINPKDIKSDIYFSSILNWGNQNLIIKLNKLDYDFEHYDLIKIYETSSNKLIYWGFVENTDYVVESGYKELDLLVLWYCSFLNFKLYIGSFDDEPANIVKILIDEINKYYPVFSYGNIETYWQNIQLDFENKSIFDCLKQVTETCNFSFYVNFDWKIDFYKVSSIEHKLTIGKTISKLKASTKYDNVVTRLVLKWKDGTSVYEDTTLKVKEKFIENEDLATQDSADIYWNNYIEENKYPKETIQLDVNQLYEYENILPGHLISIYNTELEVKQKRVSKTMYFKDRMTVYLEDFTSYAKEFIS